MKHHSVADLGVTYRMCSKKGFGGVVNTIQQQASEQRPSMHRKLPTVASLQPLPFGWAAPG
jgi:hypothetical protein